METPPPPYPAAVMGVQLLAWQWVVAKKSICLFTTAPLEGCHMHHAAPPPPAPSRPSKHTNNCCCCYCYCKSLAARCCTQPPVHVHHQLPYIYCCSDVELLIRHLAKQRGPCAGHPISCETCLLLMGAAVAHCCCECSCYCKLKTELKQHQSLQQEHYRSSDSSSSSHVELLRLRFGSQTWYKLCCCWLMLSSCPSGAQTDSRTFIGEKVRIAET
jgi:hypothetical protein